MYQKTSRLTELPKRSASQFCESRFYCSGSGGEKNNILQRKETWHGIEDVYFFYHIMYESFISFQWTILIKN